MRGKHSKKKIKNKKKSKKKIIFISLLVVLVLVAGGLFYVYSTFFGKIKKVEIPKDNNSLGILNPPPQQHQNDVINIALFGLDARNPDLASRSDSIMVLSIDTVHKEVKVSSLMRDLYVPIPGGYQDNRINAAYAFGGPTLALKTINSDFGLDVRNFVTVDFFGLEKLIDKVGGVQIDVSSAEAGVLNDYLAELNKLNGNTVPNVKPGLQILDGRQAVAYARIRYVGNGDFQRTERQRTILNLLFKKIKAQGITKLPGLVSTLLPYVQTSLSNGDIMSLATQVYKYNTNGIEQFRVPLDGLYKSEQIRGMDVLVPDLNANKQKLHDFIYGASNAANSTTK